MPNFFDKIKIEIRILDIVLTCSLKTSVNIFFQQLLQQQQQKTADTCQNNSVKM